MRYAVFLRQRYRAVLGYTGLLSLIASLLILFVTHFTIGRGRVTGAEGDITAYTVESVGHTELIGKTMFTEFLLPFEIASILLLVAIVGAVVLAKKEV